MYRLLISFITLISITGSLAKPGEPISGKNGAVSSRSQLSSDVGLQILRQGGNAIDAAVAVGFSLAVTYPSAGNLGGGGFMLIRLANDEVISLDFREVAPLAASTNMYLDSDGEVVKDLSRHSHLASGVPGSVAGLLAALDRYGSMSRQQVLAPAIKQAEQGIVLNQDLAKQFASKLKAMAKYPASMKKFSQSGKAYSAGDLWQQPDLAASLKRISKLGRDGFYKGKTAELIVAEMHKGNGLISYKDLSSYQISWRPAIQAEYRGHTIWSMPPPSSGGPLIAQMLNMLEPYDLSMMGSTQADTGHHMIEAQRRAYADRAIHLGDPDFVQVPVKMLTNKTYARMRWSDFNAKQASASEAIGAGSWPKESTETTHYSVVDKAGNAVSTTTTLNLGYGSKIVVRGAGFLLNNEMDDFSVKPFTPNAYGLIGSTANAIAPKKRMLSSMSPSIMTKAGELKLVTGSPGGSTIITTVLQVIINTIDHKMPLAEAVAAPRFHHQWQPNVIFYESGAFSDKAIQRLQSLGHQGLRQARFAIGDANSISVNKQLITAVSDPRNVGGAAAY